MWRSVNDLRGKMERFALLLLKEEGLLGRVNLQMHAVTMCCSKFTDTSGIAFGCRRAASGVERALWIADGAQLSVWDLLQPAFPADFCNSSSISMVAPEVLSSPWLPVDGAEVFQARPNMSLSKLVCAKPQVEEYFCHSKCFLVLNEMPVFHKAGPVLRTSWLEMEWYYTDSSEAFSFYFPAHFVSNGEN